MKPASWISRTDAAKYWKPGHWVDALDMSRQGSGKLAHGMRVVALLLVAASASNCSMFYMTKLPVRPCTSSVVLPVVDTAFAAGSALALTQAKEGSGGTGLAYLTVGGLGLIFYGMSAYGGFTNASKCSEHNERSEPK